VIKRFATAECNRYHDEVAAWASEHGWTYRKGAGERTRKISLPPGVEVELQVDGIRSGYDCTLLYARSLRETGVETTVTVVHLPSSYSAAEIKSRGLRRTSRIGHAEFDKKFRVRTDAPGGPSAVVSVELAEAHLAGKVPLWTLRDRELMCRVDGKTKVEDLGATVDRAVRVAELLGDASAGRRRDAEPEVLLDWPGPGGGDGADARIRIGDAERDQAMSLLGLHMSTGRLELAEYEDRCGRAAVARTRAAVEQLFEDLPAPHPDLSSAVRPVAHLHKADQPAHMGANVKPVDGFRGIPLSSALSVAATFLLGIPWVVLLAVKFDMWWVCLPVIVVAVLTGLAEAFKKSSPGDLVRSAWHRHRP
jgi:Domain of unknown function (DUF1707)